MKKLILRLLDIKDPEDLTFGEIDDLLKKKFPGWHLHRDPGKKVKKDRPALLSTGKLHE